MGSLKSNPKLSLTDKEKAKLRKAKVKIGEIHALSVTELSKILNISLEKAKEIKALAEFQTVPSIGSELAKKLVVYLNVYSLQEIRQEDGVQLFDKLEQRMGVWIDSCVEDQIRCMIHFANIPKSDKKGFDFTNERKDYRKTFGYPKDRPQRAWND